MNQSNQSGFRENISKFLHNLNSKNYAEANKSLQKAVENKLFYKINKHKNINIFSTHERESN